MTTATQETKSFSVTLKDAATRSFSAIVSTSRVDRDGDVVLPTAFTPGQKVPLIVGHSWEKLPVGSGTISTTSRDARLDGQFFDTQAGREAYETAKQLGSLTEFSIGFIAKDAGFEQRDGKRVRVIKQLELLEVSIVLRGSAYGTRLLDIKSRQRDAEMQDLGSWLDREFPRNDGGPSVHELSRRGFDAENGQITYKGTPIWSEASIMAPRDVAEAALSRNVRTLLAPEYEKAFSNFLKNALTASTEHAAFMRLDPDDRKALSEGVDGAGGFLVPSQMLGELFARVTQRSIFRRYATVRQTTRDRLMVPRLQAHATEGSVYSSAFTGGWVGETPAFADDDPAFGTVEVSIKKARASVKLSTDLADDAEGLVSFLIEDGSRNLAVVEDLAFVSGTGANQPSGIIHDADVPTVDVEGTADTINAGSGAKLMDLVTELPDQYVDARWLMRRATEGLIRQLVADTSNLTPLFPHEGRNADGARLLAGYPVYHNSALEATGTDGNRVLIFGDLGAGYTVVSRSMVSVELRERFADEGRIGLMLVSRVGGTVSNPDALRIGVV